MALNTANENAPEVLLSIRLDPSLTAIVDSATLLHERVRRQVAERVGGLLEILGVPGTPVIAIDALDQDLVSSARFIRIHVNGQSCFCSNELLQAAHSYVTGTVIDPDTESGQILEWLNGLSSVQADNAEAVHESIGEFVSLVCLEMISGQPALVLGFDHVVAYSASLPPPTEPGSPSAAWPPDPSWLWPILRDLLNLQISIGNKQVIVDTVRQGLVKGRSQQDILEDLIELLGSDVVEIQLPEAYLRQLTLADSGNELDRFALLRDGLFYELGTHHPRFHFVPVENLRPDSCAFKINHLTSLPRVLLQPDQCLTNDSKDNLRLRKIDARSSINPVSAKPWGVIGSSDKTAAEKAGLLTWSPAEYLVLCLSATLRERSACFIDRRVVIRELTKLESLFPTLIEAVRAKTSVEQITRVLRALVSEHISIRNLRSILESMLDYDYIIVDAGKYIAFDDRLPVLSDPSQAWIDDAANLTSFVRTGLKGYISNKYAEGQTTLPVYLIGPEIEQMILAYRMAGGLGGEKTLLGPSAHDKILAAVRVGIEAAPQHAGSAVILTAIEVRHHLRQVIAQEFPRLPVITYQELAANVKPQPIATISLNF